ncbi:methyltransferase [Winogradskyella sp. A3E31]|uniref:methyltransferase n=1 Tax=Winogradskyella sp. A3E31 TaxID=3349637 RepID=UPI00398AFDA3
MYKNTPHKRYHITLEFLKTHISKDKNILDLGVPNPFSEIMKSEGYMVTNTQGEDLDEDQATIKSSDAEVVTAFEIFEHLLSPYEVLKAIKADHIVVSVPLKLWFASAYRSKTDMRDRHYHEFEDWQLDWLLEKTGWTIQDSIKWTNPTKKIGIRPLLRWFTPRYYMIYATRKS